MVWYYDIMLLCYYIFEKYYYVMKDGNCKRNIKYINVMNISKSDKNIENDNG